MSSWPMDRLLLYVCYVRHANSENILHCLLGSFYAHDVTLLIDKCKELLYMRTYKQTYFGILQVYMIQ